MVALLAVVIEPSRAAPVRVADGYLLDRWTAADGLPVNGTNAVLIGKAGYLWLATFDGLARFDGQRFVVFNASRYPGLPGNRLVGLAQTPDGQLWLTTERHALVRFDGHNFHAIGVNRGLPSANVLSIHVDEQHTLWAATARGLARWDGERFRPWAPEVLQDQVLAVATREADHIWVGTADHGLVALRVQTLLHRYTRRDGLPSNRVQALAFDAEGVLWVGGQLGLARLVDGAVQSFPRFTEREILNLRATPDGAMLVLASEGVFRWHGGNWERLGEGPIAVFTELAGVAPDGAIWTIAQRSLRRNDEKVVEAPCPIKGLDFDATGAVWLATACDGLWRLRRRQVFAITAAQGLPPGPVYGMDQAPDGTLWATTAGGTLSAIRDGRVVAVYQTGVSHQHQGTVQAQSDGRIWVGQYGLCEFVSGTCRTPPGLPAPLRSKFVLAIVPAADGDLWVGSMDGIWRRHNGAWQRMNERLALPPRARVRAIAQAQDGNLWFATVANGLRRLTPDGRASAYGLDQGLSSASLRDVYEDPRGYLWIATEDRGLCRSQSPQASAELRFRCIGTEQGLYSASLHRILADAAGRLWFNSNAGVFWIERQALEAVFAGRAQRVYPRVYTERDGLPDREGNGGVQNAGIRLADGRLAFPGQGGIAIFDPKHVRTAAPASPPEVVVEKLLLPGGRELPAKPSMDLSLGERVFSVRFTGLTPGLTAPLYFRYRLGGSSGGWTEIGSDRSLSFERLPPGEHVLELTAIDAASGIAGPVTRVRLHLPAYYYETLVFRAGLGMCLLALLLFAFWRHRRLAITRQRVLETEVEHRTAEARSQQQVAENALATVDRQRGEIQTMAEARTRYFANISHELRTPLSLLVGPLQDQADGSLPSKALVGVMLRNAHRVERLVEQLLDMERIDAQRFPLRPVDLDLARLARDSAMAFAVLAKREGIDLETQLDDTPIPVRADPDQLSRVLGNLLSNALKFTPRGGRVCLTLATRRAGEAGTDVGKGQAEASVSDTGPGVPADWRERIFDRFSQMGRHATHAREGAGLGLALCREVVKLHQGQLSVEAAPGGGSRFVLRLPLIASARLSSEATVTHSAADEMRISEALRDLATTTSWDAIPAAAVERPRVLIAEDHADMRGYIDSVLAGDYRTQAVANGEAALTAARRDPPDVVVSDIVMPRRDGFGLARALRADPELAGIPLIFLTARAGDSDEIEGLALGADQYLRKPFRSAVLRARVGAALATCQRLRNDLIQRPEPESESHTTDLAGRIRAWVHRSAQDDKLSVTDLAAAMHMSRASLHRKVVADTGMPPQDYIRTLRLAWARRLLGEGAGNVSEVAYAVGFGSLSSFSRAYREHFGEAPSNALK